MRYTWSKDDIKPGVKVAIGETERVFYVRAFVLSSDRRFSQYPGAAIDAKRQSFWRLWADENAEIKKDIGGRRVVLAQADPVSALIGPFTPRALATWLTAINARKII